MTRKEVFLVLGVTALGLVPAYGTYTYMQEHPLLAPASDIVPMQVAAVAQPQEELYQSQPVKERAGVCKNSYYAVFTLAVSSQGVFSLVKRCESARDVPVTWSGTVTSSSGTASSTPERIFSIERKDDTLLPAPITFVLAATSSQLVVSKSAFSEMASTTRFSPISRNVSAQ